MRRIRHDGHDEPPRNPRPRGGSGAGEPDEDRDWNLSEGLDPEGPSAEDLDKFGSELDTCPHCGSTIYDQSEMCPQCGWYLGAEPKTVPIWVFVGVFGLVALMLLWVF